MNEYRRMGKIPGVNSGAPGKIMNQVSKWASNSQEVNAQNTFFSPQKYILMLSMCKG